MNEKEMCKVFARNLKNLIHKHDINQEELAKKLGVAKSSVSCWINAKYLPRTDVLQAICKLFDIQLSDLVLEKDAEETKDTLVNLLASMSDSQLAELETYAKFLLRNQEEA